MELICKSQNYAWGVNGLKSSVAQLVKGANPDAKIDDTLPYAELWMGTHPNGPSIIKENGSLLSSYIDKHPHCLGSTMTERFGNQLSFLFKVLSVNQALSIQAHPEKTHAEQLHHDRPDVYKDPNHKPEMALALTSFQALCGFRPPQEIIKFFKDLPHLRRVVGEDNVSTFVSHPCEENLKKCFSALMHVSKDVVTPALQEMSQMFASLDSMKGSALLKDLFLTLHSQYPGDGGCFSIYLLNYIVLKPGEAMFLGPNIIHAYLLGDCIECMACSDNVVRAGLTPKYQDVETLVSMLEYKMMPAEANKFVGTEVNHYTMLFNPPVPDFAVLKIQSKTEQDVVVAEEASASILIVIDGSGSAVSVSPSNVGGVKSPQTLHRGSVVFIEAMQRISFLASPQLLAFRAFCL